MRSRVTCLNSSVEVDTGCHHPGFLVPSRGFLRLPALPCPCPCLASARLALPRLLSMLYFGKTGLADDRAPVQAPETHAPPVWTDYFSFLAHQDEVDCLASVSEHDSPRTLEVSYTPPATHPPNHPNRRRDPTLDLPFIHSFGTRSVGIRTKIRTRGTRLVVLRGATASTCTVIPCAQARMYA